MTIKSWVLPPVSIALSELQGEFGCNPLPPTTSTTLPFQPTSSTSTTTTSTTSTSTTTTLTPNTYNPSISVKDRPITLKFSSQTIYTDTGIVRGSTVIFVVSGAPPGANFIITLIYQPGTPNVSISGTIPPNGVFETNPDTTATWPLGPFHVAINFTPLVGQLVLYGNNRILESSINLASTSTTSTSTSTTTAVPVFPGLCRSVYNGYPPFTNPATWFQEYDPTWYAVPGRNPIARDVATINGPVDFTPFLENFSMEWIGFFVPAVTGGHIFSIDSVDDAAFIWVGANALSGYTKENATVKTPLTSTTVNSEMITLTAGERYPIRIQYAQGPTVKALVMSWTGPGQSKTTNFTGRLFYSTCLPIGFTSSTTTSTTTTTTTVSVLRGMAAQTDASGAITDLYGGFTLPGVAVKLMFRLIGAGGGGGGCDGGPTTSNDGLGGSGGGGTVVLGEVILPDTGATPKILKAGLGQGGRPAGGAAGSAAGGTGGIGFGFPSGSGYAANGGDGERSGPRGSSGAGGGGGGASALFVSVGGTLYGIAMAGGGGGGGGGSYDVPGRDAVNGSLTPIGYQSFSTMNGFTGTTPLDDGGGGGGGGGGRGAAGSSGSDYSLAAGGGGAGSAIQNTTVGLSASSWQKFEVYQPPATMASNNWAKTPWISEHSTFVKRFGVWDSDINLVDTKTATFPLYFPTTATYSYRFAVDNLGSFSIDGVLISNANQNFASPGLTGTFTATEGYHTFSLTATNVPLAGQFIGQGYNPGAVALRIDLGDLNIFNSYDLFHNKNLGVDPAIAGNHKFFGLGGNGSNWPYLAGDPGRQGAVMVYWTTDLTETWDINKLDQFHPSTYYVQTFNLPDSIASDNQAFIRIFQNGGLERSDGITNVYWCTSFYSLVGDLYEFYIEGLSGDTANFCPTGVVSEDYSEFAKKDTWIPIGPTYMRIGQTGGSAVARIRIRRKNDQVVVYSKDITFTVNIPVVVDSGGI